MTPITDKIKALPDGVPLHVIRADDDLYIDGMYQPIMSDDLKAFVEENAQLKKWMEFYGIEILENGDTQFKIRTMDKFRKKQNDEEYARLVSELDRKTRALETIAGMDGPYTDAGFIAQEALKGEE